MIKSVYFGQITFNQFQAFVSTCISSYIYLYLFCIFINILVCAIAVNVSCVNQGIVHLTCTCSSY